MSLDVACACVVQGMTAHYLSMSVYPVGGNVYDGPPVCVVHAAAGGVGQILTQICKLLGINTMDDFSTLCF